jgi:hypothetical protein
MGVIVRLWRSTPKGTVLRRLREVTISLGANEIGNRDRPTDAGDGWRGGL